MLLQTFDYDPQGNQVNFDARQSFDVNYEADRPQYTRGPASLHLQLFFPNRRMAVLTLLSNEAKDLAAWITSTLKTRKRHRP